MVGTACGCEAGAAPELGLREPGSAQYLVEDRMRRSSRSSDLHAILVGILSSLLAVALLVQLAQAGRPYLYCQAMQATVAHPCCARAAGTATARDVPVATPSDCCQVRKAPALAPFTGSSPSALLAQPIVALAVTTAAPLAAALDRAPRRERATPRAGPPPARARAQLMVFLI